MGRGLFFSWGARRKGLRLHTPKGGYAEVRCSGAAGSSSTAAARPAAAPVTDGARRLSDGPPPPSLPASPPGAAALAGNFPGPPVGRQLRASDGAPGRGRAEAPGGEAGDAMATGPASTAGCGYRPGGPQASAGAENLYH